MCVVIWYDIQVNLLHPQQLPCAPQQNGAHLMNANGKELFEIFKLPGPAGSWQIVAAIAAGLMSYLSADSSRPAFCGKHHMHTRTRSCSQRA